MRRLPPADRASGFVELAFLDRAGKTVRTAYPPRREEVASSCATAVAADQLVVATAEHTFGPSTTSGIQIQYLTPTGEPSRSFWIAGSFAVHALVADGDGVVVLHSSAERLFVTRLSARDGVGATIEVPRAVDPTSADLGVDARGLYVTWLAGRTLHVLALDGTRAHRPRRTGPAPSGARTVGAGDRSVTAWTSRGGVLQVFSAAR